MDGYCSWDCWHEATQHTGQEDAGPLRNPDNPAQEVAENREQVAAMLDAAGIDARLPRIIFLRKQGQTLREVGKACGLSHIGVSKILGKLPRKLLRECGLRGK
jgi:DNA-directed RNA polymerase specialized sigma subunit